MVELTHVTRFARLMATSVRKSLSRGDFPERGELAGKVGAANLPDRAPESLEDFLRPGAGETENARDGREGLRGERAHATPSQLRALCFAPSVEALSAPEIPVPLAGLVVAESSWTLAAPILLGSEAEAGASVSSIRRSERGTEVTVRGVVFDDGGLVYAEETLYIAKKLTGEPREWGERQPSESFDLRRERGVDSMGRLDVGNRPAVAEREFTVADSRLWARYTGDVNPIHMSSAAARAFGFRRAILHGAAVEAWAMDRLGLDGSARCWGQAKFRAPALLPARLELIDMGRASSGSCASFDSRDFAVLDGKSGRDLVHLSYGGVGLERYRKGGDFPSGRIVLPRQNGRTSSSVLARGMALAAATADPRLAERVKGAEPWREGYRAAMTDLSRVDAPSRGGEAARAGLACLAKSLRFADGRKIGEARAVEVRGGSWKVSGNREPRRELSLELDGREYKGRSLLALLDAWRRRGFMRRGAYDALAEVIGDPGILDLDGWTFACLGASAALSPAPSLLAWGADVAAPVRAGQEKNSALIDAARSGAGTLILPPVPLDVAREPEAAAGWIASLDGRIAIVDTLYAPGAKFLLAEVGADVVESLVTRARPDTALAWYGSPTDAYVLSESPKARFGRGLAASALAAYAKARGLGPSRVDGVYPGYIAVQGPNYAAAKRIGRWRATVEREAGRTVSYNVGPLSMTRSVLVSRPLRAAYGGLRRLGVTPLPAEASAALMAALLAWDLKNPRAAAESETFLTDKAIDCGLFSCPYEPNGLMAFAVALGADKALKRA